MFDVISTLFGPPADESVVRECRQCGTSVEGDRDACPYCGQSADIVCYEIG